MPDGRRRGARRASRYVGAQRESGTDECACSMSFFRHHQTTMLVSGSVHSMHCNLAASRHACHSSTGPSIDRVTSPPQPTSVLSNDPHSAFSATEAHTASVPSLCAFSVTMRGATEALYAEGGHSHTLMEDRYPRLTGSRLTAHRLTAHGLTGSLAHGSLAHGLAGSWAHGSRAHGLSVHGLWPPARDSCHADR